MRQLIRIDEPTSHDPRPNLTQQRVLPEHAFAACNFNKSNSSLERAINFYRRLR